MSNSSVIDALAALSHSSSQCDEAIAKLPRAALLNSDEDKQLQHAHDHDYEETQKNPS